jgi:hypothetical protein
MLPHLKSRSSHLCQEFAFLPTAPPRTEGGIFELRIYQLKPGTLLEWESTWCVIEPSTFVHQLIDATGGEELKHVESWLPLLVHGFLKSAV